MLFVRDVCDFLYTKCITKRRLKNSDKRSLPVRVKFLSSQPISKNDNLIAAAIQRQKFDILAGWDNLGARCLECDSYMLLSNIASTRS